VDSVIAQGEAAGTLPWHRRKPDSPLNFDLDPKAHWYYRNLGGDSWYPGTATTGIVLDCAHMPALGYLPFALTGDPYFLEELQFEAVSDLGIHNPDYRQLDKCLVREDQTRSYAWSIRALFQLATLTPENVPSWLLPLSYWQAKLDNNRQHFLATWIPGTGSKAFFHIGPMSTAAGAPFDPWMQDFLIFIIQWGINMGHPWQVILDWLKPSLMNRINGASGWPRQYPSVYNQTYVGCTSWADAWAKTKVAYSLADPPTTDTLAPAQNWGYAAYCRGALAALDAPEYDWLHGELVRLKLPTYYKWSVAPR
jgi:hypothetical protein